MREDFVPFMAKLVESQNMKNPSLGELRSLYQINQVSKEDNQRRNLASINFVSHLSTCEIFASPFFNLLNWWGVHPIGQRANKAEGISQVPFQLVKFSQVPLLTCERLAKAQLKKSNFASLSFNLWNFRKSLLTYENSPCVIFRYFSTDSVRFLFQDILCNYPLSSCNQPKIFLDIVIS